MEHQPDRMDIKDFREYGFLQELNRQFLHPMGMALEVEIDDNGNEYLGGIWDYTDDEEGIYYDIENRDYEKVMEMKRKREFVDGFREDKEEARKKKLGFIIEPIE